ncbi:MAG: hypothetical protein V1866_04180 [archaeon]
MFELYKRKLKLQFKPHKDPSKASYALAVPSKALKYLKWDTKSLCVNNGSLICTADEYGRIIYQPTEQFESAPLQRAAASLSQSVKRAAKRRKQGILFWKIKINDILAERSLSELQKLLPEHEEDIKEIKKSLELARYTLKRTKEYIREFEKQ